MPAEQLQDELQQVREELERLQQEAAGSARRAQELTTERDRLAAESQERAARLEAAAQRLRGETVARARAQVEIAQARKEAAEAVEDARRKMEAANAAADRAQQEADRARKECAAAREQLGAEIALSRKAHQSHTELRRQIDLLKGPRQEGMDSTAQPEKARGDAGELQASPVAPIAGGQEDRAGFDKMRAELGQEKAARRRAEEEAQQLREKVARVRSTAQEWKLKYDELEPRANKDAADLAKALSAAQSELAAVKELLRTKLILERQLREENEELRKKSDESRQAAEELIARRRELEASFKRRLQELEAASPQSRHAVQGSRQPGPPAAAPSAADPAPEKKGLRTWLPFGREKGTGAGQP